MVAVDHLLDRLLLRLSGLVLSTIPRRQECCDQRARCYNHCSSHAFILRLSRTSVSPRQVSPHYSSLATASKLIRLTSFHVRMDPCHPASRLFPPERLMHVRSLPGCL